MRILVVDDNEDSRILVQTILEAQGHDIECAEDGFAALEIAVSWQPGLIISDIMMPKMDGYELCRKLKDDPELKYIPVVLFSVTYTDTDSSQLAKEVGASRFILKTMAPAKFVAEINEVIQQYTETGLEVPIKPIRDNDKLDRLHYRSIANKLSQKVEELNDLNKALRNSRERYRTFVEGTSDAIITFDDQARIASWNPGAEEMFGYKASEVLGKKPGHFLVPERLSDEPKKVLSQVKEKGFVECFETVRLTKGGTEVPVEISLGAMKSESGKSIGASAIVRDITERKKTEKSLKERTAELMARVNELSCLYSISKIFEQHNVPLAEIIQKSLQVIPEGLHDPEKSCVKIVYRDREFLTENFKETEWKLAEEIVVLNAKVGKLEVYKLDVPNKNGHPFAVDEIKLIEAIAGRLTSCIERVEVENGKKVMEKQLTQAQKMEALGTLAGGITHDFNNILAAILGYADMAREEASPESPLALMLDHVLTAGNRAKELVQQILVFSRQSEHERQPIQPHLLVKEVLKLLRASIPSTINIRQQIDAQSGTVFADATHLHQIVMNLCTNAYHAMRQTGGILTVTMKAVRISSDDHKVNSFELTPGAYVMLAISDTGCGMDKKTIEKIFDPYFTTKKIGEGTGLGLSVVHGILKSYNGHITVYSEPDKGSTFYVYLPQIISDKIAESQLEKVPLPGGTERILVVDDEKPIMTMQQQMLESFGYKVKALASSAEALQAFQSAPQDFDILITDMTMPDLTGVELNQKIKAIRPDIPVILCTGFSELIDGEEAQALGFQEFIMKPILKRDLALVVRKVLDAL